MKKIDVVILHYNNLEDTTQYVENLRRLNWSEIQYHFIIVDNASPDGSGKQLEQLYREDPVVRVLLSQENLGFAKGNNLGITYAAEQFGSDFIAVSNNDIEIRDLDFFQTLCSLYDRESFAVCGPDIYSVGKQFHQSPIRTQLLTEKELETSLTVMAKKLRQLRLLKKLRLYEPLRKIKHLLGRGAGGISAKNPDSVQYDVVVHGAFFVLTQEYLARYPWGLYPETFMYQEEDILAYLCARKQLKIRYCPELKVLHYDGVATLKAAGKRVDKYIFELENTMQSATKHLELMRQHSMRKE